MQRQEAPLVAHIVVGKQAVIFGLVHQVHDLGLDARALHLGVQLEDLVQGGEVAQVDVLTQALKLGAQVIVRSTSASLRPSSLLTRTAVPRHELM
jgi:hypothetical protein